MKKLAGESKDIEKENLAAMQQLFPEAFEEGKIDFDALRQLLGDYVDDEEERYSFRWNGKGKALRLSQTPSTGTLRPCKEESKNWDTTENLYIEGDNLEVLKLLQKSYHGKVKMIYIDPPYNTGKDFVYKDDFRDNVANYKRITGQVDDEGHRTGTNSESNGRFHTDWLNMMYPRLRLARNLLSDDGVIFISIDDNELRNMRIICDEIFGEVHCLACFPRVTKKAGKTTEAIAKNHDYIVAYSKTNAPMIQLPLHTDEGFRLSDAYETERGKYKLNQTLDYNSLQYSANLDYPIMIDDETIYPGQSYEKYLERKRGNHARADWAWRWSKEMFAFGKEHGFIVVKKSGNHMRLYTKTYQKCKIVKKGSSFSIEYMQRSKSISTLGFVENLYSNDNSKKNLASLFEQVIFDYSKPIALLKVLTQYATDTDSIVLDFFSGSATTAHAVMNLNAEDGGNRRFILVQLPETTPVDSEAHKVGYENICEIGKERIRRAGEKVKAECEDEERAASLDIGFKVFKLDSSNLQKWQPQPEDLFASLQESMDNFLPDRTNLDVVYEIALKLGLDLSYEVEEREADGQTIYIIGAGALMICLDSQISMETAEALLKLHEEYEPETWQVVFRDTGFLSDQEKTNIKETLKSAGLDEDAFISI